MRKILPTAIFCLLLTFFCSANEGNTFTNCFDGIRVDKNSNVNVLGNTFNMNTAIDPNSAFGHAIFARNCTGTNLTVNNNTFTKYVTGIQVFNTPSSFINISENTFSNPNGGAAAGATAINIQNSTTNGVSIFTNKISFSQIGIIGTNAKMLCDNNMITMPNTTSGAGKYYGIRLSNCALSTINQNTVTCSIAPSKKDTTKLYGVSIQTSAGTTLTENKFKDMGTGIECVGNMPGSTLSCNWIITCYRGLSLIGATIGDQISNTRPQDNQWLMMQNGTLRIYSNLAGTPPNWWYRTGLTYTYIPSTSTALTLHTPLSTTPVCH